ncbi:MAG: DNA polymerase III subunit beta [Betaproteobacteria bacterium]|nr:DNA polymerase III subunit beta [Betaproteobacteria bacterium]
MILLETTRDALLRPLQAAVGIVERRHTLPILSNVLIARVSDRLDFIATDLEIQITVSAPADAGRADFSITVSAKKLQDICRSLPEDTPVVLEAVDSKVTVRAGRSRFSLQTLPADHFPRLAPLSEPIATLRLTERELKRALGLVQYAMAQQDIRYYLNGALLVASPQALHVVATDGHRLSFAGVPVSGQDVVPHEVILPRKTVLEVYKLLADSEDPVSLEIGASQVKLTFGHTELVSKVIDGKFPDYTRVIPTALDKHIVVSRETLLHALQRAAILSNEKLRGVRLVLTDGSLRVISTNSEQEEAQEELEVDYQGDSLDIGFNVTYLLDVLTNLSATEVQCAFGDAGASALITLADEPNFKYVVMPMRI